MLANSISDIIQTEMMMAKSSNFEFWFWGHGEVDLWVIRWQTSSWKPSELFIGVAVLFDSLLRFFPLGYDASFCNRHHLFVSSTFLNGDFNQANSLCEDVGKSSLPLGQIMLTWFGKMQVMSFISSTQDLKSWIIFSIITKLPWHSLMCFKNTF